MTILEAIQLADRREPNDYSAETKLRWLSNFDAEIRRDVIDTHVGAPREPFCGYDCTTDIAGTELLVAAPYDEIYPALLSLRMSVMNKEGTNSQMAGEYFSQCYYSFTDWYNRTHLPCGVRKLRF